MHKGKVRVFFPAGYGFITALDSTLEETFFHFSELQQKGFKKAEAGDIVSYELGQNNRGVCAVNVQILEKATGEVVGKGTVNY